MSGKGEGEGSCNGERSRVAAESKGIDLISSLPDDLIVHILSLLPTIDNVRTGALSRGWQYLWTRVPSFYITLTSNYDLHKTLSLLGKSQMVKSFGVECKQDGDYYSDVTSWIDFAASRGIEKFELKLYPSMFYELPLFLYENSSFRELSFGFCYFDDSVKVSWICLKKMTIFDAYLTNEALGQILAGTPVLESLDLTFFNGTGGVTTLRVGHLHLKKLILDVEGYADDLEVPDLEISVPTLESLKVSGYFRMSKLVDVSSLVEATLFGPPDYHIDVQCITREAVDSLLNVPTLTLDTWVIQGIETLMTDDVPPSVSTCKCLTIDTYLDLDPIPIAKLLKTTTEMETLIITTTESSHKVVYTDYDTSNIDQFWKSQEPAYSCWTHLRTVKFIGLKDHYSDAAFSFAQFVLKNAKVLQKMVVNLAGNHNVVGLTEEAYKEKILGFHRSSPDAQVFVYP